MTHYRHSHPKLLTPISHLFNDSFASNQLLELSDYLEGRERTIELKFPSTSHFHIDFNINIGLSDKQLSFLSTEIAPREGLQCITFQAATDCEDFIIKDGLPFPNSPIISFEQQIINTKESISKIRDIFGQEIEIGIENNNYYPTHAFDICTTSSFLLAVIEECNIHLLYDMAHAMVTCFNRGEELDVYESQLFTASCKQLHLCQPLIPDDNSQLAKDVHELPTNYSTQRALQLAREHSIPFITVEYYKDPDKLASYLKALRCEINNSHE